MKTSIVIKFYDVLFPGNPYRQTVEVIQFSKSRVLRNTEGTDQQENSTAILQTITNKSMHSMPIIGKEPKETKKYDLLINAYMNSGSRFTGSLFGFRYEIQVKSSGYYI